MSLFQEACEICEELFNDEDDEIITSCNHRFHRKCAEERVQKRKLDCRICKKPLALEEALYPKETIPENTCAICNETFDSKLDLIITSCFHTFHRRCAEKRVKNNRPSCRVCKEPSVLANALLPDEPIANGYCPICEQSLDEGEDLIITKCRHTYHRTCAERRLKKT